MTDGASALTAAVPLWLTVFMTLTGSVGSFFLGCVFMSKKDRADIAQKNYENSIKIRDDHKSAYNEYTGALLEYSNDPSKERFVYLCKAGDVYFNSLGRMCDTILSGKADVGMRDNTWFPQVKAAYYRTLSAHYAKLKAEAPKHGLVHDGKVRRKDHEALFSVVEQYSSHPAWLRLHEDG